MNQKAPQPDQAPIPIRPDVKAKLPVQITNLSMLRVVEILRQSAKLIAAVTGGAMLVTSIICWCLPHFYAYTGLLEVAKIEIPDSASSPLAGGVAGMAMGKAGLGGLAGGSAGTTEDIKAYLDFKYVDKYRTPFDDTSYLKSVDPEKTENYLRVVAYATSLEEAKTFLDQVFKDLEKKYQGRIQIVTEHASERVAFLETQIAAVKRNLEKIRSATSQVGMSPVLLKQEGDMQQELIMLEDQLLTLRSNLADYKIHNVRFDDVRPERPSPMRPKTIPIVLGVGIFFFLAMVNLLVFLNSNTRSDSEG